VVTESAASPPSADACQKTPMGPRASDFSYTLPPERIAQQPAARRDASRLMVLHRAERRWEHRRFGELPGLLRAGDLLVLNDTRVIPARFTARRASGGQVEGLFLREEGGVWEVMLRNAGRCRSGEALAVEGTPETQLELVAREGGGCWRVRPRPAVAAADLLARVGRTPLPPYIRRPAGAEAPDDRQRYQTVYAARDGAVAAPTAGLHFTEALLAELGAAGVHTVRVTLHVGLGTFAPVQAEDLAAHRMHAEWYDLPSEAAERVNAARRQGRRVVAVGTTSVRVLESAARAAAEPGGPVQAARGWTDLFLYPPADFHVVDALVTNFHLPRSTLLMLAAAFCAPGRTDGTPLLLEAYADAVRQQYRFYSYGDAMLIE